ncbi:MAG TPA: LamG domain-containing protein [Candidatus Paceibacterota bacterium]|nr:LamG domain-containing protein [Candidatus Paceibacterota bacterium]
MKKGFTLIELLVVISIVSLLSSVVLSSLNSARAKAAIGAGKQFDMNVYHAAADQAVGVWDFDECSGSSAADRSGSGNNGTLQNSPSWSTDSPYANGCSIAFNSSYVSVPDNASLELADNFTVSMWVKMAASGGQTMILKGDGSLSGASLSYGWDGHGFQFIGWNTCNAPYAPIGGNDLNTWHQIVGVVSGGVRTLYVDGAIAGTPTSCGVSSWNNSRNLNIGGNSYNGSYVNAKIDQVRVYAKTLTAQEVGRLYADESPKYLLADK